MTAPAPASAPTSPQASAAGGPVPVTYLDVAATQIQSYLSRTRRLWGRRGASAVLAERASPARNPQLLYVGDGITVEPNPQAGEKDGVVSVIVASVDDQQIRRVAEHIAGLLLSDLPGLPLSARWAAGPTYIHAYSAMNATGPRLQWLPPRLEYPPNLLCQECGFDAATDEITVVGTAMKVCADCFARRNGLDDRPPQEKARSITRHPAVVHRTSDGVGTFTIEAELLRRFDARATGRTLRATDDLKDLAEQGDDPRGNHIATIAADGNSLGRLFHAATHQAVSRTPPQGTAGRGEVPDRPPVDLLGLSRAVTAATKEAVLAATEAAFDPDADQYLTVVPHILGGDDVLVSVPADRAWRFVRALLTAFDGGTEQARHLAAVADQLEIKPPSLSAGVVISHAALPFGQQVALAEQLLIQAKTQVEGDGYSVAWLDTTVDGPRPVTGRHPWTAAELDRAASGLTALASIPASARQALAREIDTPDHVLAQVRVRSRLDRQDPAVRQAVQDYLDGRAPNLLAADWKATDLVNVLRDGLSLARWWR